MISNQTIRVPNLLIPEARRFFGLAEKLRDCLDAETGDASCVNGSTAGLSEAVREYFAFFSEDARREDLVGPGLAAELNTVMEVCFPIRSSWTPRSERFGGEYSEDYWRLRDLVADLSALFSKVFFPVEDGPRSYFVAWREWRQKENFTEYDCLFETNAPTVVSSTLFSNDLKYQLLRLMGSILLQYDYDPAPEIRKIDRTRPLDPMGLLHLQVQQLSGDPIEEIDETDTLPEDCIEAALLYWAANDELCSELFCRWDWYHPVDFDTPISSEERASLLRELGSRGDDLYETWIQGDVPSGIARSLMVVDAKDSREAPVVADLSEAGSPVVGAVTSSAGNGTELCLPLPGQRYAFDPTRFAMFGPSEVGKTSYLCSLAEEIIRRRPFGNCALGADHQLIRLHGEFLEGCRKGECSDTVEYSQYGVSVGRADAPTKQRMNIVTTDFRGGHSRFDQFPSELEEIVYSARGFLFFVDDRFFSLDPSEETRDDAQRWSEWCAHLLRQFHIRNPDVKHIPIALVINKADRILGDELLLVKDRPYLLRDSLELPLLTGLPLQNRVPEGGQVADKGYDRLWQAVVQDLEMNRHGKIQRLARQALSLFRQFFEEVQKITYRYQIFLGVSVLPSDLKDSTESAMRPLGVRETFSWLSGSLFDTFESQARDVLHRDRAALTKKLSAFRVDFEKIESDIAEQEEQQREYDRLMDVVTKRWRFARIGLRSRMKWLSERIQHLESRSVAKLADLEQDLGLEPGDGERITARCARVRACLEHLEGQCSFLEKWGNDANKSILRSHTTV